MEIGEWVRRARKSKGWTLQQLGDAVGRTKANVGHWESGKHNPSYAQMIQIAQATGYPMPSSVDEGSANVIQVEPRKRVPLISWVRAGDLHVVQEHDHPGEADEWIDVYDARPGESAFALRVEGDSMTSPYPGELSFPEGTIIVIDPLRGAAAGDFVVAKDVRTQRATFKKLATDGGRWFLKPLNPSYPTIEIDDPAVRVIGRVIEYQTRGRL